MRQDLWNIALPKSFQIGPDLRLQKNIGGKYLLWEIRRGWDEFKGLTLQSQVCYDQSSIVLYPIFSSGSWRNQHPDHFPQPPILKRFAPNYLVYDFSPLPELQIEASHLVAHPNAICTKYRYTNTSLAALDFSLQLVGITNMAGKRIPFQEGKRQGRNLLQANLDCGQLIIFLGGGAEAGLNPSGSLKTHFSLESGQRMDQDWIAVVMKNLDSAEDLVFNLVHQDWNIIKSRIVILEESRLRIKTGNPSWDFSIAFSQKEALLHAFQLQAETQQTREKDPGYPTKYSQDPLQAGESITPLQGLHLLDAAVPVSEKTARNILRRIFSGIPDKGGSSSIDHQAPIPLVAELLWQVYSVTNNLNIIKEYLPIVEGIITSWFSLESDKDGDGIPEWSHLNQFEMLTARTLTDPKYRSLLPEISTIEDPLLAALLYRDLKHFLELAKLTCLPEEPNLIKNLGKLKSFLNQSWNAERASFVARDFASHKTQTGRLIYEGRGSKIHLINTSFSDPSRLTLRMRSLGTFPLAPKIILHGQGQKDQTWVEEISAAQWNWTGKDGYTTSSRVYSRLDFAAADGLHQEDRLQISQATHYYHDIGELFPLWGIQIDPNQMQIILEKYLPNQPSCWTGSGFQVGLDPNQHVIQPALNKLLGEGLLLNHQTQLAADLFQHMCDLISSEVIKEGVFSTNYAINTGRGMGKEKTISGLLPLGFFLRILGVTICDNKIKLEGISPFSNPISLSFRGITVIREKNRTIIQEPGEEDQILPGLILSPIRL